MREYSIEFENVAVTAAQDFFSITAADDKPCSIMGLFIDNVTEVGDAMEEMLRWRVIRGHATVGSGGSAPTPRPLDPDDVAASFTARANDTTIASTGTAVNLHSGAFNVRSGLPLLLPPELRWITNQTSGLLVVRLMAAPADSVTMSGTLYVAEGAP